MDQEKWYYIKHEAGKRNERFLVCNGVLYEVTKTHYPTGRSPLWSINEVHSVEIPDFVNDPEWIKDMEEADAKYEQMREEGDV